MKSKMNRSKKRMKNKKGRNGNRSVKMRGGESIFNSYEKQFDKKVMENTSGKKDVIDLINKIQDTEKIVTELNSKIVKAYQQIDKVDKNNVVDPRLNADISNFNEIIPEFYNNINVIIPELNKILNIGNETALKRQKDIINGAEAVTSLKELEKISKNASEKISNLSAELSEAKLKLAAAKLKLANAKRTQRFSSVAQRFRPVAQGFTSLEPNVELNLLEIEVNTEEGGVKSAENALKGEVEKPANEFLAKVEKDEVEIIIDIIKRIKTKFNLLKFDQANDKDNIKKNKILEIIDDYNKNMNELIDVKRKKYKKIFENKKKNNYTTEENEIFYDKILENINFEQYNNLVNLYDAIVTKIKRVYTPLDKIPDMPNYEVTFNPMFAPTSTTAATTATTNKVDITKLIELCNNINKYDLSRFKDAPAETVTTPTIAPTGYKKNKNKTTDININFYKSTFKEKNPFSHYEEVIFNRSGQGVIGDLYKKEEDFQTFKNELQYLADPKKFIEDPENEYKFKPFKRKHIKIEHTKNDKSAPIINNIFE